MSLIAAQMTDVCTYHGEGPVWDAAHGVLRFLDVYAGDLLTFDPRSGALTRRTLGPIVTCVRPRRGGGLVVALRNAFLLLADDAVAAGDPAPTGGGVPEAGPAVWTDPTLRFNDGGCDPAGRFFCGSMAFDAAAGRGTLYRLDVDGRVCPVLTDLTISNGLWFAPDGAAAYYADSATGRIDVLTVEPTTGTVVERRPFVRIPAESGVPDGLTVDVEGGVWVAVWGGSAVHRYDPAGRLDAVVTFPASQVSCPAFGAEGGTDLYVTTSREHLPDDAEPRAGALFRVDVGIAGVPVLPYGG